MESIGGSEGEELRRDREGKEGRRETFRSNGAALNSSSLDVNKSLSPEDVNLHKRLFSLKT